MAKKATDRTADSQAVKVISFRVPADLESRFLNAVGACAGQPEYMNYTKAGRLAVEREVERLERKYNKGRPFPQRPED